MYVTARLREGQPEPVGREEVLVMIVVGSR